MSVAVSNDCGRALVPATRDMFMLGSEGSANERANEENDGKAEVEVEVEVVELPDSRDGGCSCSCLGGGMGGGCPSAFDQASRALCSSWCASGSNASRMSACAWELSSDVRSSSDLIPPDSRSSSALGLGVWSGCTTNGGVGALSLHGLESSEGVSVCRVCKDSRGGGIVTGGATASKDAVVGRSRKSLLYIHVG